MKTLLAAALALLALAPKLPAGDSDSAIVLGGGRTNDPETSKILAGELGGIGVVVVDRRNDGEPLRISNVVAGSPAEKAGIKPPCFLLSVNGTNVVSMPIARSRSIMLGPVGTSMTIEVADVQMSHTNKFTAKRGRMVFSGRKTEIMDK
jgi:C-terminal processing protease CtpA/Prc